MGLFDKISNLIYEDDSNINKESKKNQNKKGSWKDIFFEDVSAEDEKKLILDDITYKIERKESELINLAEFFKTVNPKDYPDSAQEYEAYLSLVKQLNTIKTLATSSQSSAINLMSKYQLESNFKKFELDYKTHIGAIQSLCYLSEISTLNSEMEKLFDINFTSETERRIAQIEGYITLINQKSNIFDKKYSTRFYKQLIESEYRLTLLKLMIELKNEKEPRRNPFVSFSTQKKIIFETYLSKGIRDSNIKYNTIADNREKYTKYTLIKNEDFDKLDVDAAVISERINKYTIDDFLLSELLENGEGFETLNRFLKFKLTLNFIDSKTAEADRRLLDDQYRKVTSDRSEALRKKASLRSNHMSKISQKYPSYEDDL